MGSTKHYLNKIAKKACLSYEEILYRLTDLNDFIRDDSFPKDGETVVSDHHIMYKMDTLYSKDGMRGYEFLIEFSTHNPSTGIYYGVKNLMMDGRKDEFIKKCDQEWKCIKNKLYDELNNVIKARDIKTRFKTTDNANDDTYWPFWISLQDEEDIIDVAVCSLRLIRKVYQAHFGLIESLSLFALCNDGPTIQDVDNNLHAEQCDTKEKKKESTTIEISEEEAWEQLRHKEMHYKDAVNKGLMTREGGKYKWNNDKYKWRLFAYFLGRCYCNDTPCFEDKQYTVNRQPIRFPEKAVKKYFGKNLALTRRKLDSLPTGYDVVDEIFDKKSD